MNKGKTPLEATLEGVKRSRFPPRLIGSLDKHLGITQRELAILTDVAAGAVHLWEIGQFKPSMKKKAVMVALRKLDRREVRKLLEEKENQMVEKKAPSPRRKRTKRVRGK